MTAAFFLLTWLVFAVISGRVEAHIITLRQREGDPRKLDHRVLVAFRAVFFVIAALLYFGKPTLSELYIETAIAVLFGPAHRFAQNLARPYVAWWYMGPQIRLGDDSWYDGVWHSLSARNIEEWRTGEGEDVTRYVAWDDRLPIILCTAFEILISAALFLAHHLSLQAP